MFCSYNTLPRDSFAEFITTLFFRHDGYDQTSVQTFSPHALCAEVIIMLRMPLRLRQEEEHMLAPPCAACRLQALMPGRLIVLTSTLIFFGSEIDSSAPHQSRT